MTSVPKTPRYRHGLIATLLIAISGNPHTCPPDATAVGVEVKVKAFRTTAAPLGTNTVAIGETILLEMSLHYFRVDPMTLGWVAAFEGGTMTIRVDKNAPVNVTPPDGVPLVGGNDPFGCTGVPNITSQRLRHLVSPNDVVDGIISVSASYTNGMAHIGTNNLPGIVWGSRSLAIRVDNRPFLQFAHAGNALRLSWADTNSVLEESWTLGDDWTSSPNQQNPQELVPSVGNRFYRLTRPSGAGR